MKDLHEEYDDVFKDIVYCYLEDNNICNLTDDEVRIIANRLICKNKNLWEHINDCVNYEIKRLRDLKKKEKKEEER